MCVCVYAWTEINRTTFQEIFRLKFRLHEPFSTANTLHTPHLHFDQFSFQPNCINYKPNLSGYVLNADWFGVIKHVWPSCGYWHKILTAFFWAIFRQYNP